MSWIGLVLLVVGVYLAFKLVGALLKIAMFVLALVGAYWLAAPYMGWPTVSELVYVLGPDFGGRRIEDVVRPSVVAGEVADRVVDGVVEGVVDRIAPAPQPLPEPEAPVAMDPAPGDERVAPLPDPGAERPPR
ncbi:hypothetical protein FZO89_02315 [Luteimonas viscosa]|uniref:Uncharacterized protein n=1 Tax=Luteimonas viscosa TaxID=1132694 RepID=A0A5D4XKX2_9GAMM|nr:hypothetical protein [Luteimonas viscosa]TYT25199.1 hypothetical protein FZO89_02315 [Luteimonas viscosa]